VTTYAAMRGGIFYPAPEKVESEACPVPSKHRECDDKTGMYQGCILTKSCVGSQILPQLGFGMIKQLYTSSFALIALAAPAFAACPDPSLDSVQYAATGPELIAPQTWDVDVAGTNPAPCPEWLLSGLPVDGLDGFLSPAPTAVFELEGMGPHIMMVMAEAECSPMLAVRGGDGIWEFGRTANGRQEVTLWGVPDGPLHVWVGSATQETCEGTLTLETFDR